MKERIYGYFTKGETEGEYEVTVVLPTAYAEFFGVESQWELVLEGAEETPVARLLRLLEPVKR